jgi:hypothetical protein
VRCPQLENAAAVKCGVDTNGTALRRSKEGAKKNQSGGKKQNLEGNLL